jgi:hypothetical protein
MRNGDVGPHRAHVSRRFGPFGDVSVWIDRPGLGLLRLAANGQSSRYEEAPDGIEVDPTFSLDEDAARALLDALAAYFGGTGAVQTLRRDYDAERARVDRLIDKLLRDTT